MQQHILCRPAACPWAEFWTPPTAASPCAGSLFSKYPFDMPTEAFSLDLFTQAFAATQASVVHLQVTCQACKRLSVTEQRAGTAPSRETPSGKRSTAVIWHRILPGDSLGGRITSASLEICGAWMSVLFRMQFSLHAFAGHRTFMLCLDTCQIAALHVLSGACGAHHGTVSGVSRVRWLHAGSAHVQALCPRANGPPAAVLLKHSQGALMCVLPANE